MGLKTLRRALAAGLLAAACASPGVAVMLGAPLTAQRHVAQVTAPATDPHAAALARLYAALARAQNAAATGDMPQLRQQLAQARSTSQALGGRYLVVAAQVVQLQRSAVVNVGQVQGLLGQLGQQEALGQQRKPAAVLTARLGQLSGSWALPLQLLVLLLSGAALHLFRRVFGQRWALFWLGLGLLLLPYLLDTASGLLGALGARLGWGPLRALLALSGWNSWGWLLRGLCSALGLLLWAIHFWRVGVQFGVYNSAASKRAISEHKSGPWELD